MTVKVSDDGVGTPPDTASSGLVSLRERAERHGGMFEIRSVEPHGTEVCWSVPLDQ